MNIAGAIEDFLAVKNHGLTHKGTANYAVASSRAGLGYLKTEQNSEAIAMFTDGINAIGTGEDTFPSPSLLSTRHETDHQSMCLICHSTTVHM